MSPATIIVLAVVVAVIGLVVWYMIRNRKAGKSSCGCACNGCPSSKSCHGE